MGAGYIGKTTNGWDDLAGAEMRAEREDAWGPMNGEIVSFDSAKQTASVKPLMMKKIGGEVVDLPQIDDVPVRFARAGGGAITMPVKPGDKVRLSPMMRNSETYLETGEVAAPPTNRSFSLSDMEAHLAGGEALNDPIKNFDAANFHQRFDPEGQYGIRGSAEGKIAIEGAQGNPYKLIAEALRLLGDDNHTGFKHEKRGEIIAIADKLDAMAL